MSEDRQPERYRVLVRNACHLVDRSHLGEAVSDEVMEQIERLTMQAHHPHYFPCPKPVPVGGICGCEVGDAERAMLELARIAQEQHRIAQVEPLACEESHRLDAEQMKKQRAEIAALREALTALVALSDLCTDTPDDVNDTIQESRQMKRARAALRGGKE